MKKRSFYARLLIWRVKNIPDKTFILILSVFIGFLGGMSAVIIKNSVHLLKNLLTSGFAQEYQNYLYIIYPFIGISLAVLFIRFVLRQHVGHGIPSVLYAISKNNGIIKAHNIFSSIITSTFTVAFGGSVGLEGPTVATGAAIGSNLGQFLRLNYKQITLLLGLACAAAMAAIFKSPIAAVVFAIEVIMIDLTMASIVPLLVASATAVLTSYFFLGQAVLYPFEIHDQFKLVDLPYYLVLGVLGGIVSIYFTKMYLFVESLFIKINQWYVKLLAGGIILGLLVFFFPALYGEGYGAINTALSGDFSPLFDHSIFYSMKDNIWVIFILFILIILFKVIATTATFGAGGIGGIFAPTLFTGGFTGLFFATLVNYLGLGPITDANFALVGMGGLIAGVLHAPLTGIFLIAEITSGYGLFVPLMVVATISYATVKIVAPNSVYTHQLARRGELITHHKDRAVLTLMRVDKLLETNFKTILPGATLRDLVNLISESTRNVFPVVARNGTFHGIVRMDDIRHIIFKPERYDDTYVRNLMFYPEVIVSIDDSMEEVAGKFHKSGKYVLPVLEDNIYKGFVSRANVFSEYRKILKHFSDD